MTGRVVLAAIASLVVIAAIVTGVVILGPPAEERARRLDRRRAEELDGIRIAVNYYRSSKGQLPTSVNELLSTPGIQASTDPVTGAPYGYRTLSVDQFELCATFDRASVPRPGVSVDIWHHPAGAHCFTLKVDKAS